MNDHHRDQQVNGIQAIRSLKNCLTKNRDVELEKISLEFQIWCHLNSVSDGESHRGDLERIPWVGIVWEKKNIFDFTKTRNLIWRRSNGLLCRANWKSLSSQEKTAALWADNNRTKQANAGSHFHLRDAARPVADRAHFVCRWDASKWRNGTREQIRFRPAAEEVSCHKLFHSDTFADES